MQAEAPRWNYFRLLEKDLEDSFRYVQPCKQHYGVYSEHFARVILIASTEIENCIKSMAKNVKYQSSLKDIDEYNKFLILQYPNFTQSKVLLPWYGLSFEPWLNWAVGTAPDWWKLGYNKIKHDRENSPDAPTLQRAIDSVAALFVLLLHYYRTLNGGGYAMPLETQPHLFALEQKTGDWQGGYVGWSWKIPGEP
jgi:hypothetical protein